MSLYITLFTFSFLIAGLYMCLECSPLYSNFLFLASDTYHRLKSKETVKYKAFNWYQTAYFLQSLSSILFNNVSSKATLEKIQFLLIFSHSFIHNQSERSSYPKNKNKYFLPCLYINIVLFLKIDLHMYFNMKRINNCTCICLTNIECAKIVRHMSMSVFEVTWMTQIMTHGVYVNENNRFYLSMNVYATCYCMFLIETNCVNTLLVNTCKNIQTKYVFYPLCKRIVNTNTGKKITLFINIIYKDNNHDIYNSINCINYKTNKLNFKCKRKINNLCLLIRQSKSRIIDKCSRTEKSDKNKTTEKMSIYSLVLCEGQLQCDLIVLLNGILPMLTFKVHITR